MKKLNTITALLIVLALIIHMIYMTLAVTGVITPNEDFAQNFAYVLMYVTIFHGMIGLCKWFYTLYAQRKISRMSNNSGKLKLSRAAIKTLIQRGLGVVILAIIIPHGNIKVLTASGIALILDIVYIIALLAHLWIGIPKLIVSLGLRPANAEQSVKTSRRKKSWK